MREDWSEFLHAMREHEFQKTCIRAEEEQKAYRQLACLAGVGFGLFLVLKLTGVWQ